MSEVVCACGHARDAHRHYRAGSDCGACGPAVCGRFQRRQLAGGLRNLLRRGRDAGPGTAPRS